MEKVSKFLSFLNCLTVDGKCVNFLLYSLFYKPYAEIRVLAAKHVGEETDGATSQLLLRFKDGVFTDLGKKSGGNIEFYARQSLKYNQRFKDSLSKMRLYD